MAAASVTPERSRQAISTLCETYYQPVYNYVRHDGYGADEASDIVQGFFESLVARNQLGRFERREAKFRSFLLTALRSFIIDEYRRRQAQKRGGQISFVPLDASKVEEVFLSCAGIADDPARAFDREWAQTLLGHAVARLKSDYRKRGKQKLFDALSGFLDSSVEMDYARTARRLGMKKNAVEVAVHRMRRKYTDALREEVAETLADPHDDNAVEDELNAVLDALSP